MTGKVIVIGAGLAGILAAFAAQREGAEVLVLDRSGMGLGTNSAMANGMFTGTRPDYPPPDYVSDTIVIGKGLNRRWMVDLVAEELQDTFEFIRPLGFDWEMLPTIYAFKEERSDIIRGAQMMRALSKGLSRVPGVNLEPGFQVTEILHHDGRAIGVAGWDRQGHEIRFGANAVILATGGAGALYLCNDNQKSALGQGYNLAVQAGLDLWDLEFVQFYPLVLDGPSLPKLMLYPPYPPECRVINGQGEDVVAKYGIGDLNQAISVKRDEFSAHVFAENRAGQVYMDFTQVPERAWSRYPLAMAGKYKFNLRKNPAPISPGAHFFMGGVCIDQEGMTSLPGLFACGEVVWGLHGANRRGGNALSECVVFGRLAGTHAARHCKSTKSPLPPRQETDVSLPLGVTDPIAPYMELRRRLREIAWYQAGIVRSGVELEKGRRKLVAWEEDLRSVSANCLARARLREDLRCGALVLKGIIKASLGRQESRGSFLREEYLKSDDHNWLKNSRLTYHPATGEFSLDHLPVS